MKVFLHYLKLVIAVFVGIYIGLMAAAFIEGLYLGGYLILFAFGSLLFLPATPLIGIPYALILEFVYKRKPGLHNGKRYKLAFLHSFVASFFASNLVFLYLDKSPDLSPLPVAVAILICILLGLLLLTLFVHIELNKRGFKPRKIAWITVSVFAIAIGSQYYISLPHLSAVCNDIEIGDSRQKVKEMLTPFAYRDVDSFYHTNAEELEETEGDFFLHDRGVFCTVRFNEDRVIESFVVQDGP